MHTSNICSDYCTGGSFAFADHEKGVGYTYVINKMDFYTHNDPREVALKETMNRCINNFETI